MRILIASDLTDRSANALRRAVILAGEAGAELRIVHVLEEGLREDADGERDALYSWLESLKRDGASLESVRLVRALLDRVLEEIARLSGRQPCGFDVPASLSNPTNRSMRQI